MSPSRATRIVYVGRAPVKAKQVIDATGKVVSPGFFDMHAHSEFGLSLDGRALSKVTQGITTEVLGEHLSAGPVLGPAVDDPMMVAPPVKRTWTTLGGFFSYLEKKGIGLNVASYVGAGQVRASAMGYENRTAHAAEMERMKQLIRQGDGRRRLGPVSGPVYVPNSFFNTAADDRVGQGRGQLWRHLYRPYAQRPRRWTGLQEAIEIAKGAHIPVEIFHVGRRRHGATILTSPRLSSRRASEGMDITANAYPYTIGWTYVRQLDAGLGAGRQCRRHHRAAAKRHPRPASWRDQ